MPELYVGLMSGTSLDGIDTVIADLSDSRIRLLHCQHQPFQPALQRSLLELNEEDGRAELHRAALAANQLAQAYASSIRTLLSQARIAAREIAAIGCHGQTVRHHPEHGYTIQLVNGALLAELAEARVVCDFRSRDIAAGGQGAPLVPAFHHACFQSADVTRIIVNVGGIANLTILGQGGAISGFDCGPGNILLDAWIMENLGRAYDESGAWAAEGKVDEALLARLEAHPFLAATPPKSTGREAFNLAWLRRALLGTEAPVDVQATLLLFTARAIAAAVKNHGRDAAEVFLCGGGALNSALLECLRELLPERRIATTNALGVDARWVEALAFAWLAQRAVRGEQGSLPSVTGASGSRVLGAIYPA